MYSFPQPAHSYTWCNQTIMDIGHACIMHCNTPYKGDGNHVKSRFCFICKQTKQNHQKALAKWQMISIMRLTETGKQLLRSLAEAG